MLVSGLELFAEQFYRVIRRSVLRWWRDGRLRLNERGEWELGRHGRR